MDNRNVSNILAAESSDLYTTLASVVNKKNIVNVGIITKVINDNFVNVKLYHSDTNGKPIVISSVRLIHIGTAKCKINIQPAVGDNVLILANRDFIGTLEYNHEIKPKGDTIEPYDNTTVQGIIISPESEDNALSIIRINENGDIDLQTKGTATINVKGNVEMKTEGDVKLETEGKVDIQSNNGMDMTVSGDVNLEADNVTVKGNTKTEIKGGQVKLGGTVTASGTGALCGLPTCLFTGAPHVGDTSLNA